MLGDGHVQKRYVNGKSRFIYAQSSLRVQHLNYFTSILELFKPYLIKILNLKIEILQIRELIKFIVNVSFATLSLPCFNVYKNLFYNSDNLKIVPSNISKILSPPSPSGGEV